MKLSFSSLLIAACLCLPGYAQDTDSAQPMTPAPAVSTPAAPTYPEPVPVTVTQPSTNVDVHVDSAPAAAAPPPSQTTIHVDAPAAPAVVMPSTQTTSVVKETNTNNRVVTQPAERNDSNIGLMFVAGVLALGVIAFVVSKTTSKGAVGGR